MPAIQTIYTVRCLLVASSLLSGLLRAELTYCTVADFDNPAAQAQGGVSEGLDSALIGDGRGTFYGVARRYGANGKGFVFRVTTDGQKTTLHSFAGSDGEQPLTALCRGKDGAFAIGTIFRYVPGSDPITTLTFAASRYTAPPIFTRILTVGDTLPNTQLLITQDSPLGPLVAQHPFSLLLNNAAQFSPTDPGKTVLIFKKTTGQFTGSFLQSGKRRPFSGVVLQKTVSGAGHYSDGKNTQPLTIVPIP